MADLSKLREMPSRWRDNGSSPFAHEDCADDLDAALDEIEREVAAQADARLPCDVIVGGGVFREGVPVRLVLDAIERQRGPKPTAEDMASLRADFAAALNAKPAVAAVPDRSAMLAAVSAMEREWDEWATENQGTRECFEAAFRAGYAAMLSAATAAPASEGVEEAALDRAIDAYFRADHFFVGTPKHRDAMRAALAAAAKPGEVSRG